MNLKGEELPIFLPRLVEKIGEGVGLPPQRSNTVVGGQGGDMQKNSALAVHRITLSFFSFGVCRFIVPSAGTGVKGEFCPERMDPRQTARGRTVCAPANPHPPLKADKEPSTRGGQRRGNCVFSQKRAKFFVLFHERSRQTIQNLVTINIDKKYVELVRYTQFRAQT